MIGVRNNLKDETVAARYDGQDYKFAPGVTVALSEDAARHIFGYGEKDKTRALHRLGWLTNSGQLDSGLEKLNRFQFLAVEEVKFKEDSNTMPLRAGIEPPAADVPLSEEEQKIAKEMALAKPETGKQKFGK